MYCSLISVEFIGFAAGLTNLVSSIPQLLANLGNPTAAAQQSASRNACQCAGNGMWLYYGVSVGSMAMSIFSTLGFLMAGLLLWQVHRSKRRISRGSAPCGSALDIGDPGEATGV